MAPQRAQAALARQSASAHCQGHLAPRRTPRVFFRDVQDACQRSQRPRPPGLDAGAGPTPQEGLFWPGGRACWPCWQASSRRKRWCWGWRPLCWRRRPCAAAAEAAPRPAVAGAARCRCSLRYALWRRRAALDHRPVEELARVAKTAATSRRRSGRLASCARPVRRTLAKAQRPPYGRWQLRTRCSSSQTASGRRRRRFTATSAATRPSGGRPRRRDSRRAQAGQRLLQRHGGLWLSV